jgi:hypothetical protein
MLKPPKPSKVDTRRANVLNNNPVDAIHLDVFLLKIRFPFGFLRIILIKPCRIL